MRTREKKLFFWNGRKLKQCTLEVIILNNNGYLIAFDRAGTWNNGVFIDKYVVSRMWNISFVFELFVHPKQLEGTKTQNTSILLISLEKSCERKLQDNNKKPTFYWVSRTEVAEKINIKKLVFFYFIKNLFRILFAIYLYMFQKNVHICVVSYSSVCSPHI